MRIKSYYGLISSNGRFHNTAIYDSDLRMVWLSE
jgi:hypothetical protein